MHICSSQACLVENTVDSVVEKKKAHWDWNIISRKCHLPSSTTEATKNSTQRSQTQESRDKTQL